MVSRRPAHLPHVSCFSFSIYFSINFLHPFLHASGFHYPPPHSLHFFACTLCVPRFHQPQSTFSLALPKGFFSKPIFLLVFFWLHFHPPCLQSCLSPPALTHTTDTPPSMETFDCLFHPLKPFPDSSSTKKAQLDKYFHLKLSKGSWTLQN